MQPDYTDEELLMEERDTEQDFAGMLLYVTNNGLVWMYVISVKWQLYRANSSPHCLCGLTGPVALSTACKLIAPGAAISGTMSITKSEMYFEMDEENEENKRLDSQVLIMCVTHLYQLVQVGG